MIFYVIDSIFEKIKNIKKVHRRKPNKLKLFCIWISLIILVTIIFYLLGAFETNNNIPLKLNSKLSNDNEFIPIQKKKIQSQNIIFNKNKPNNNLNKSNNFLNKSNNNLKSNNYQSYLNDSKLKDNLIQKSFKKDLPNIKNNLYSNSKKNIVSEEKINEILSAMREIPKENYFEINHYNIE
jgi:hypothetical protein